MVEVDVRGLSCPIPVMHVERAVDDGASEIFVLADSGTARANVVNLLRDAGYDVSIEDRDGEWAISAKAAT